MTPNEFLTRIIRPGLATLWRLGGPEHDSRAECFLLAVAMQESNLRHRYQVLQTGRPGPARGWWQFERNGGVVGVCNHPRTRNLAASLCTEYAIRLNADDIWRAIEGNDGMATGLARLLLWSDPFPIPVTADAAWEAYAKRLWRPGKPHPDTWPAYWAVAYNHTRPDQPQGLAQEQQCQLDPRPTR